MMGFSYNLTHENVSITALKLLNFSEDALQFSENSTD